MPSNKDRVNLTLPDDLLELVRKDAGMRRLPAATRITQIIDEHYRRVAAETSQNSKILKGSELLVGRSEMTMDFSAGLYEARAQPGEPSKDAEAT